MKWHRAAALVSLLPLLVYWRNFQQLFFFHDDWELLNGYSTQTLPQWLAQPFLGEGILPLFKLFWITTVQWSGGGYIALIVLLWMTHFLIALLFGQILLRLGMPDGAAAFAVLMFGLSWTNIETLGWSMQWSAQLGLLFFFLAWQIVLNVLERPDERPVATGLYVLCVLASGLCSSRSITGGTVLAVFILLSGTSRGHLRLGALSLLPAIALTLAMWLFVPHPHAQWWSAASYATHYFLLNPLYLLISFPGRAVGTRALLLFGTAKAAVLAWAIFRANRKSVPLLTVLAFDLLNAVTLGYARSYIDVSTTISSRYQYISLLCFAPAAGVAFMSLRKEARVIVLAASLGLLGYPWRTHLPLWARLRGADIRMAIDQKADDERFDPSSLSAGRARELIRQYHLH
jgi:hypothetical protein